MTTSSREAGVTTKLDQSNTRDDLISRVSSNSTSWSRLNDPRIVRASRALGGKDRHSKVCTVRGLRDRRVRLSVPTAIQLYDLQDRLGFNQPSKVVDWLLNVAKHEIDELPPLQIPPGNFALNYHPMLTSHGVLDPESGKEGLNWNNPLELPKSSFFNSDASMRHKSKEVRRETEDDEETWTKRNEEGNLFPRSNHSSLPGLLNNSLSYSSFLRWDPINLSLSQSGSHEVTPQTEDFHNFNVVPLQSTLSTPTGSQVFVCPTGTQRYFPSPAAVEFDPKQINFQMASSSSQNINPSLHSINQSMRPFQLGMNPRLLASQNSRDEPQKDSEFPTK